MRGQDRFVTCFYNGFSEGRHARVYGRLRKCIVETNGKREPVQLVRVAGWVWQIRDIGLIKELSRGQSTIKGSEYLKFPVDWLQRKNTLHRKKSYVVIRLPRIEVPG